MNLHQITASSSKSSLESAHNLGGTSKVGNGHVIQVLPPSESLVRRESLEISIENFSEQYSRSSTDAIREVLIDHGSASGTQSPISSGALKKSAPDRQLFESKLRELANAATDSQLKSACEDLMSTYLRAHQGSTDPMRLKVLRSAQKKTLAALEKYIPRFSAPDQTEILSTFIKNHLTHLLFHETTERCAQLRGIQTLSTLLKSMQSQGHLEGRAKVASTLFAKIPELSTDPHQGIGNRVKGNLMETASLSVAIAGAPFVVPTILGVTAQQIARKKTEKQSKTQNKGVSLVDRELSNIRNHWRQLSRDTKRAVINRYNIMQNNLRNASNDHGKKVTDMINRPDYRNPNNFDAYWARKSGNLADRLSVAFR